MLKIEFYSQNEDLRLKLIKIIDEIVQQKNKKSKLEKIELLSTIVSSTITFASLFYLKFMKLCKGSYEIIILRNNRNLFLFYLRA